MNLYELLDRPVPLGKLVIVEGTDRALAERAVEALLDRLLPVDLRPLNLDRFGADDIGDASRVREAVQAMPFLAERRVVLVADAQTLRADARRALWEVAQAVPDGNVLILLDLLAPRSKRPEPYGPKAGKAATRIDVTATEDVRARFIAETLAELGAKAEPRVVDVLARSSAELSAVRNDLTKLALQGKKIALADLEREALSIEDPKAYKYASALVEGRLAEALAIAHECFAADPRGSGVALLAALASECGYLWEMAREGGALPARLRWRERALRPIARRAGARRSRVAHARAVAGVEAIVTGSIGNDPDEARALVERISVELASIARPVRR